MSTRVLIRTDVSASVGLGHARRCQALAATLSHSGAKIVGVLGYGDSRLAQPLFAAWPLECRTKLSIEDDARWTVAVMQRTAADILILDTYRADVAYQQVLVEHTVRWLQFDSQAQQPLYADWVLNASPGALLASYEALCHNAETRFLLGPRYAQINPIYAQIHAQVKPRTRVQRMVLCLGGGDDGGATWRVLNALAQPPSHADMGTESLALERLAWEVIIGQHNPQRSAIETRLAQPPYAGQSRLHVETSAVATLLATADLGIIAGGTLSYEAAAVGLPMLLIRMADNQRMNIEGWTRLGAGLDLGDAAHLAPERLQCRLQSLLRDRHWLNRLSQQAYRTVDGRGTQRLAEVLNAG